MATGKSSAITPLKPDHRLGRAVGLPALWTYLVPLLTAVSAATIAAGVLDLWPRWTSTTGSALFVVASARILFVQPARANVAAVFLLGMYPPASSRWRGRWSWTFSCRCRVCSSMSRWRLGR